MVDGLTTGLFVSKADEDFYEVSVADGDSLTVDIFFLDDTADVDIYLYDDAIACGDLTSYLVRGLHGLGRRDHHLDQHQRRGRRPTTFRWSCSRVRRVTATTTTCRSPDPAARSRRPCARATGRPAAAPAATSRRLGAEEGCNSSLGFGAKISAAGTASVANDDLSFSISQAVPNQPSLLVQGSVVIAVPFKDGLLCMGNPTERVEVVFLDANGEGTTADVDRHERQRLRRRHASLPVLVPQPRRHQPLRQRLELLGRRDRGLELTSPPSSE